MLSTAAFGDVFANIGCREPQPQASEVFTTFGEAHRSIERYAIKMLKTIKPVRHFLFITLFSHTKGKLGNSLVAMTVTGQLHDCILHYKVESKHGYGSCNRNYYTATGHAIWDLPPGSSDFPAFTQPKLVLDLATPRDARLSSLRWW